MPALYWLWLLLAFCAGGAVGICGGLLMARWANSDPLPGKRQGMPPHSATGRRPLITDAPPVSLTGRR